MTTGSSLEQVHILVLAHILRRPIIVYGIKYVKNLHGDNIGYAGFQGLMSWMMMMMMMVVVVMSMMVVMVTMVVIVVVLMVMMMMILKV